MHSSGPQWPGRGNRPLWSSQLSLWEELAGATKILSIEIGGFKGDVTVELSF